MKRFIKFFACLSWLIAIISIVLLLITCAMHNHEQLAMSVLAIFGGILLAILMAAATQE